MLLETVIVTTQFLVIVYYNVRVPQISESCLTG